MATDTDSAVAVAATAVANPNPAVDPGDKAIRAMQTRYTFWKKKEAEAMDKGNADDYETAVNAVLELEKQAKAIGFTLVMPEGTDPTPPQKDKASNSRPPKSVVGAEKVAARAKEIAENKAKGKGKAAGAGTGAAKAPKPNKEKVLKPCLCGCGTMVSGNFKMGHDSKLKSLILKIERGEEDMKLIPDIAQDLVKFKKGDLVTETDGKGNKTKTQQYICTAAPVKFPGRPEVALTQRD
jgi:hypothetical protein